ncbi:hypothetical protein JHD48_05010 [Sulfurimonas sp. SAG-AH-194-I05]|nr:hypothetical protein [Sulfurimonas sp. SAG-AH-194-I05]MDF1875085.1 hypothetical protein [Sulfurimonas sp. SAG-AH-194-I05]
MSQQDETFENNTIAEQKQALISAISNRYKVVLLDKKNIQVLFGISAATLNRLISNSIIPYIKLGNSESSQVKFVVTDVIEMIFENRIKAFNSNTKEKD